MILTKDKNLGIFSALLLFIIFFLSPSYSAEAASGAYGWFSPKVTYVSDTPASAGCSVNQASLEIWLVELGTQNQISNNSGDWDIKVLSDTVALIYPSLSLITTRFP